MTGEITLRGRVLPVGGVREKALAALRAGIGTVILPQRNLGDLDEIPQELKRRLRFVPVRHMDEVLEAALADRLPRTGAAVVPRPGLRAARIATPR